jgi:hypothetical protein
VSLLRKSTPAPEPEPAAAVETSGPGGSVTKGRPTPKRRDVAPKRQPVSAPRTTKEANQLRKQNIAAGRSTSTGGGGRAGMSTKEFREAMRRGDESVLPRRDKGQVRKLARNYVDTHFLFSNFLLLMFPLLLLTGQIPNHLGTYLTIGFFVLFAIEWLWVGRRIHSLAVARFGEVVDKPWVLGLYAGQRAFMPRRWRQPAATLKRGDPL